MPAAERNTFFRFLLAGGTAALVNVGSRVLYSHVMGYLPSVVVAYLTGMVTAFVLNRYLVFDGRGGQAGRQFIAFVLVNGVAVAQTVAISFLLGEWLLPGVLRSASLAQTVGHVVGVLVPVLTSYLGHKHFSFRKPVAGS